MKSASFKLRIKALLIDYMCIVLYILILFALTMSIYAQFFHGIPEFSQDKSQLIALLTTVFPITIYFSIKESRKSFASYGKKKAGIKVKYLNSPIIGSIIRNIFKFLPWELGHVAVIKGIYNGFESYSVMMYYGLAVLLPIIYIVMVKVRKDHRHIPDFLAASYVVENESK